MYLKLFAIVVCSVFISRPALAQDKLVLKQQLSLNEVSEVVSGGRQNMFLAKSSNSTFIFIDQASKLQLGSMQLELSDADLPGKDKSMLWGDSSFIISTGIHILLADPITGRVDTLFNANKFPEFIINYTVLPRDESKLLIVTKTYPVKNGNVSFSHANKQNEREYDDTKNCRFLLLDIATKKIVATANTPYAITTFASGALGGKILAGTFDGDVVEIDSALGAKVLYHAFDRPVHSLLYQQGLILAVPHIGAKYIGELGDGDISIYNVATQVKKDMHLPVEKPVVASQHGMNPDPFNNISRMFSWPQQSCVLVNYGFSRLLKVSLPSLDTVAYSTPFNAANFYCFNKDSTQLLAATAPYPGLFTLAGDLIMYDLQRHKVQSSFIKPAEKIKYNRYYKIYDEEGNYHYIGHKEGSYRNDTLVVYSSNKTSPTFFSCRGCEFVVNEQEKSLTVTYGTAAFYGHLHLGAMLRDQYEFSGGYAAKDVAYPQDVFTLLTDTKKYSDKDVPYGVAAICDMGAQGKLITGNGDKNDKSFLWLRVIDTAGQVKFSVPDYENVASNNAKVSPSLRYIAYVYNKNKDEVMEVWDVPANKKVFSKSFPTVALSFFTFDKTRDVLFYSYNDIKASNPMGLLKVDLIAPAIKEALVYTGEGFLSFEVDIAHDHIASEQYDKLYLWSLNDMKLLWQLRPGSSFFKVSNQPGGFSFSSATECHVITNELNYIYFTSFSGYKPVEILNDRLYKGDKEAINNLAFVLHRKGAMPGDFDMYFNRPDSVLLVSGSTNTAFNLLTAKAVEKRKRHKPVKDLEEFLNHRPLLFMPAANNIADVVNTSELKLSVLARSVSGKAITAFHIVDNGVPVFGSNGFFVSSGKTEADATIAIPLVKGQNNLQVFAEDAAGYISSTENISVVADYAAPTTKIFFIGIGIDKFADSKYDLQYSAKDIRDLATKLKQKYGENIRIDTLFNERVTIGNVRALKQDLARSNENDKVIISYSGHGLLSKEYDYYLSTYDVNFKNPQDKGLPYDALEWLLDSIPARKKLMLIDACHSGEVDKEEAFVMNKTADSLGLIKPKGGEVMVTNTEQRVGLNNSFELMQSLFVNVGKTTGATNISAAAGNQFALEIGNLKNGVFTYAILEAMNKYPTLKISELKKIVGERVEELTQGLQKPTSRNETIVADWSLW